MALKKYPLTNPLWDLYLTYCRIRKVDLLYYLDYNKKEAVAVLEERLGWKNYGAKHYESIWTRFFQGYYLPKKFGVDKRKAHLSSLVVSGQMTREEALRDLGSDPYPPGLLETDKEFIMKKLRLSPGEFEEILNAAPVPHEAYGTDWYLQVPLRAAYLLLSRYRDWAGKSVVRG